VGPVICLITRPSGDGRDEVARIAAAARAGVHLVQIRKPDWEGRDLTRLVEQALGAVRGTRSRVLVNDRLDVALAAGAHGVHLRGDGPLASRLRAVVPPGFMIGRSVHAGDEAQQVAADGGADYLVFGTVFATSSKPGSSGSGVGALAAVCEAVPLPVLAIGGVTLERLGQVATAGAAGFLAIGLFHDCPVDALADIVTAADRAFDRYA
jgi:thiamine-phosphate pyrophosphorylase